MVRRFVAFLVLIWAFGFVWFAIVLPGPAGDEQTDAVVVVTGGEGRVDRALNVVRKGWSPMLLVSGVDREVRPVEFAAEYRVSKKLMKCCVVLGFESFDTRSNAQEASRWIAAHGYKSVRLVTSDWHMRRAALEMGRVLPKSVTLVLDAVPTKPSLRILFLEYHKYIARALSLEWRP